MHNDDPLFEGIADAALPPARFPIIENAADLALQPFEPIEYDIETILPAADAPALLFGPPASLKSWIGIAICDAIVRGAPFVGLKTRQRPRALYVNLDAGARTFRNRVRAVSSSARFDIVSLSSSEFSATWLRQVLDGYHGGFVVLDCLSSIYAPDMKTDPAHAMRSFVDALRTLFAEFDCGGLVIDHPHRPKERGELGDFYGSIQKEAAFRTMWAIISERSDDPTQPRRTKISCRKLSEGSEFSPIELDVQFGETTVSFARAQTTTNPDAREFSARAKILEWGREQTTAFSRRTVVEKVRGQKDVVTKAAFEALIRDGAIEPTGAKRGGGDLYRVAVPLCEAAQETQSASPASPGSAVSEARVSPIGGRTTPDRLLTEADGRT